MKGPDKQPPQISKPIVTQKSITILYLIKPSLFSKLTPFFCKINSSIVLYYCTVLYSVQ